MEEEQDDQPYSQAVVLSQTCWEYRTLTDQEQQVVSQQQHVPSTKTGDTAVGPTPPPLPLPAQATAAEAAEAVVTRTTQSMPSSRGPQVSKQSRSSRSSSGGDGGGERLPKRAKTSVQNAERDYRPAAGTTALETLRLAGKSENPKRSESWDIFVLVLQASGLQQITSKAGSEVDFGTLLVADQSVSFFRLTLWARAARAGGRLIRPGDLVRFNK